MTSTNNRKESVGVTEKLEDFFRDKIENGVEINDKNTYKDLAKSTWDNSEINLKRGSRDLSYKALNRILKEKGIEIPQGIGSVKKSGIAGGIEATFEGAGKKVEQVASQIMGNPQQQNQPYGIFGNQNQSIPNPQIQNQMTQPVTTIIQAKVLSDSEKQSNKRFIVQTMQLPKNLFAQLGIIDEEEVSKQEKPKKWGDEVDEWVESLADWCNENGFSFPAKLEMIMLGVTGISLFVLPVIMKIIGTSAEKKKEAKKNHEPNPLDKLLEEEPEIVS